MSLTGIIVPLVTPVAENGGVDHNAVLSNAQRVLGAGVQGLYLCGGTGDAAQLRTQDRRRVVEAILPVARAEELIREIAALSVTLHTQLVKAAVRDFLG